MLSRQKFILGFWIPVALLPVWSQSLRSHVDHIKARYLTTSTELEVHILNDYELDADPGSPRLLSKQWSLVLPKGRRCEIFHVLRPGYGLAEMQTADLAYFGKCQVLIGSIETLRAISFSLKTNPLWLFPPSRKNILPMLFLQMNPVCRLRLYWRPR
jgi:hypothetical protein